jgi:tetratricopeptide (TPR) repeat protein
LTILDRVGQLQGTSPRLQALVDRANLALGAWFLRSGQGGSAVPVLGRIGSSGPSANRAFLDLGWAWLAPEGSVHQRVELGDERSVGAPPEAVGQRSGATDQNVYQRYTVTPFVLVHLGNDSEARLKQALAVWSQVQDRDPEDGAVQQTLLAIGYALDQLGAHQEAVRYLERGKAGVERSLRTYDRLVKYVDTPSFIDDLVGGASPPGQFRRKPRNLPPPELAPRLYETLAGREFHSLLADYQDLQTLSVLLEQWAKSPVADDPAIAASAELHERIVWIQQHDLALMRKKVDHDLEPEIRWRLRLLENTRLELGRVYSASVEPVPR